MKYHILAFVVGFILDLIIGDPHNFPHPIRLIRCEAESKKRRDDSRHHIEWNRL